MTVAALDARRQYRAIDRCDTLHEGGKRFLEAATDFLEIRSANLKPVEQNWNRQRIRATGKGILGPAKRILKRDRRFSE